MKSQHNNCPSRYLAITLSILANLLLGLSSLYWRALGDIPSTTLVAYRIVVSAVILTCLVLIFRHAYQIKHYTIKLVCLHAIASILIAINWAAFILASINGYLLESGLGYLLAPFISIALGAVVYREHLTTRKTLSTVIAFCAIAALIISTKQLNHWTYVLIASTWGAYTYIKKSTSLDAINGLLIETLFLAICLALAIMLFELPIVWPYELPKQSGHLIWLAGWASIIPLLMFSYATGKIPLSITGFIQFILPLTLFTLALLFRTQAISNTSLMLIISTASLLITLITYDLIKPRQPQRRTQNEKRL